MNQSNTNDEKTAEIMNPRISKNLQNNYNVNFNQNSKQNSKQSFNQNSNQQLRNYTYKHSYNRSLEELNLMDSFLFEASTEDSEDAKKIAKVIIERVTGHPVKNLTVETQKELKGIFRNNRESAWTSIRKKRKEILCFGFMTLSRITMWRKNFPGEAGSISP